MSVDRPVSITHVPATRKHEASGSKGMVTANHPLGALAGVETLMAGGNAVDAAIATMFALSVVEPMMTSIFGAGFINIRLADGTCTTIDNYATVPAAARADMFEAIPGNLDLDVVGDLNGTGYLAAATSGMLLGAATAVSRYGRLPLSEVLAPAIRHARRGFRVSPYLQQIIVREQENLARFPASAAVFLPGGAPPGVDSTIVRGDYADTLQAIAEQGPDVLYRGEIGRLLADDMRANGGLIDEDDLAGYQIHERPPVFGTYRDYEIIAMGPPSSGGTHIIEILNILEGFDLCQMGFGSPDIIHLIAEAMKIAFADRARYMGDPATTDIPLEWLTSKRYAEERRAEIDLEKSSQYGPATVPDGEGSCTTHCCAADADGGMVSTTQTLNSGFGSKVTVPGTGMFLNNCMHLVDPTPGGPNSIVPGRRILSSMSPTLVTKDGKPFLAIGTPGGVRIFGTVMQGLVNIIDHGMSLQEALEAPRLWDRGPTLELETGFAGAAALGAEMERRGHVVELVRTVAGGMNGILFDTHHSVMRGGACWRADGAPVSYSGGDATIGDEPNEAMWS
jgi:gamma-glutamyltranspeptidase / glutathione hydrolase